MMPNEQWKNIPGYEGVYQVSDHGRIKSLPRPWQKQIRFLNPWLNSTGYRLVDLYNGNNSKPIKHHIHSLVLTAFTGKRPNGMECRHLDGNRQNNQLYNLCWGTASQNQQDRLIHKTDNSGSKQWQAKLTDSNIYKIKQLLKQGRNNNHGPKITYKEIAQIFDVHLSTIGRIANGKTWKHILSEGDGCGSCD